MNTSPIDLPKVWSKPDYSRLSPKQISIRLSIIVAAKIAALNDLYPEKTKTEIINDLLGSAIDQLEEGLPGTDGKVYGVDDDGEEIADHIGTRARFISLTEKHLKEIEVDSGIVQTGLSSAYGLIEKKTSKMHSKSLRKR